MAGFIGLCAILIVALSPLLRRLYIVLTGVIGIFIFAKIRER
jgi:hypothetical protein